MDKQIPLLSDEGKDEEETGHDVAASQTTEAAPESAESDFSIPGEGAELESRAVTESVEASEEHEDTRAAKVEKEDEEEEICEDSDDDEDEDDDEDDEDDEESFAARGEAMNQPEELQQYEEEDPLAGGFDLDHGNPLDDRPTQLPWQSDVSSPKEFFNTEMLYRFDIVDPDDRRFFEGTYRIELKGNQGGVWTITVGNDLGVVNRKEDAEIVLSMSQKDFMELVNGKLNPQLAILAQKVKIHGDVKKALLFQALLAPTVE